jgi:hypothetical protein
MRILLFVALALFLLPASGQSPAPGAPVDTDRDGLSDAIEDALLSQFAPRFMVSDDDCSLRPAQFLPHLDEPQVEKENGTIYGQAFPRQGRSGQVELHYYHLWRRDCGEKSHPLDAEHVSALVARDEDSQWKAVYWYAAAHEDTVCDASQIARAAAVDGERHGPTVWISRGKHASFLNATICAHGCGGDKCPAMTPLADSVLINLGEPSNAMNGATWAGSHQWPLPDKMGRSDFAAARLRRLDQLPATSIAWANPGTPGMKSTIRVADTVRGSTAGGLNATSVALDTAQLNTEDALGTASGSTGRGLSKSARGVKKALRATAKKLGIVE